jgi:hypothetical protein
MATPIGAGLFGVEPVAIPGKNFTRKGKSLLIFTLIDF